MSEMYASTFDTEMAAELQCAVDEAREEMEVPGLQVSVILRGVGKWSGSAGWADRKQKRQATIEDMYHLGSVSKLYTAALVLKLVQEGRLGLADNLSRYFPDAGYSDNLIIQNLLNHTSGLYDYADNLWFMLKTVLFQKRWTLDSVLKVAKKRKPHFEPGLKYFYSNTNYLLLGKIVEMVTGQPFAMTLNEHILNQLELSRTYFAPEVGNVPGLAKGYDVTFFGLGKYQRDVHKLRLPFATSAYSAGAIVANSADVAEFTYQLFEGELLLPPMKELMRTFINAADKDVPGQVNYGLGVSQYRIGGEELLGHTGVFPGYSNVTLYSPTRGYVVTVLSNLSVVEVNYVVCKVQRKIWEHMWKPAH